MQITGSKFEERPLKPVEGGERREEEEEERGAAARQRFPAGGTGFPLLGICHLTAEIQLKSSR